MAENHLTRIEKLITWLNKRIKGVKPTIGIIMGSGLSEAVPALTNQIAIPYSEIPGFLNSTVQGHAGQLVFGRYGGKDIVIMRGRFHFYEGHDISEIAVPIRMLGKLGVKTLIITSAVGSVHKDLKPGEMVVLKDHINFMGRNPLRGCYDPAFGPMFPDMTEAYAKPLRAAALKTCRQLKIKAREGVYMAGVGPSYETPAEVKAFREMGADVVGMSVVPEVITARQMGVNILGLSWVTNLASGVSSYSLSHEEVLQEGKKVAAKMKTLLEKLISTSGFGA